MSCFLSKLEMENLDAWDDGRWRLTAPLLYSSEAARRIIKVPVGFITDLASVPRMPIVFVLCGDTSREAAVVHDYLYSTAMVPRSIADAVFREASAVTGVPAWRRWIMWAGIRIGGASHYGTN